MHTAGRRESLSGMDSIILTPPPTPSSYEEGTFKGFVKSLTFVGVVED
jgi:hypothetical protein